MLRDELGTLELRASFALGDAGRLHLGVGTPFRRELTLEDDSGSTLLEEDLDRDPYLALGLELSL